MGNLSDSALALRFMNALLWAVFTLDAAVQNPLEQAVTLTRAKRYSEAQKQLEGVPEPATAAQRIAFHRLKAAIASGLGQAPAAAVEMRRALELAPNDSTILLGAAVAEMQAGELDEALGHANAAGDTAAGQFLIGGIQERRGAFVEAATAYQRAVELAPDREDYRIALALEFVEHQTFAPAIKILEQGAALFPRSARIRTLLGIALYATDSTYAAISALVNAIARDPQLEPAHAYLASIVLGSTSSPPESAIQALCGWNAVVCAALQLRVAREQDNAAMFDKAVAVLKAAPPSDATARCELGRAYEWRSQWKEARKQMEACVALNPSLQNHYRLGLIYSALGASGLAQRQMQLRTELLRRTSEESERRLDAIQAFRYSSK